MIRILALATLTSVLLGPVAAFSQPSDWNPPETPWGDPDLQGVWTNATLTPLERSDAMVALRKTYSRLFTAFLQVCGLGE